MADIHSKYWCTTKTKLESLIMTWTIEHANFHLSLTPQFHLQSAEFFSSNKKQKWRIVVKNQRTHGCYFGAYLKVQSAKTIRADFSISILGSAGEKLKTRRNVAREFVSGRDIGFDNFIKLNELLHNQQLVPNDTLTLQCEVNILVEWFNNSGKEQCNQAASMISPHIDNRFKSMLHSGLFTDVVIVVGKREIKVHKIMLAVQSTVFEAMLDADMTEKSQNRIVISDLDYEVIEQMLLYIYTSKVPKLQKMADRLLVAADKYALDRLKAMCEQTLCSDLSTDNAIKLLTWAEMYNASQLKPYVTRFLDDNIPEVRETSEWKNMIEKYSNRKWPRPSRLTGKIEPNSMATNRSKYWCNTKSNLESLSMTWTIEHANFNLRSALDARLESAQFLSRDKKQKWSIVVCNRCTQEYVEVYLVVKSEKKIEAEFSISILDSAGQKFKTRQNKAREFPNNSGIGFSDYIKLDDLLQNKNLVPNDALTLHCEVNVLLDCLNDSGKGHYIRAAPFILPPNDSDKRFGSMLHSERFTDCIIVAENREIKVHKIMLASHSTVFEAILKADMTGNSLHRIVIKDLKYEVIEQMLLYIYTSKVPKLKTIADRLLVAANKYALDGLQVMCEQALCGDLSTNKAIKLLALAELYNARQLKRYVTRLLDDNIKEIRETSEWKNMIEQHPYGVWPRPSRTPKTAFMKGIFHVFRLIDWFYNAFYNVFKGHIQKLVCIFRTVISKFSG